MAPTTPGSIHEGGELGYSLSHAFGAAFDNPDLIVACVIGDGEAETGPLATAWHSNKFLNPITDGAVLPILHLNGYKISNPTVLARIEHRGAGAVLAAAAAGRPTSSRATIRKRCIELMAATLDKAVERHPANPTECPVSERRSPAALADDRPSVAEGLDRPEGCRRPAGRGYLPIAPGAAACGPRPSRTCRSSSRAWMKSYQAEELFDEDGRLLPELADLAPKGDRRMGANPHANGGLLLRDLRMPDFRDHAVTVPSPGRWPRRTRMVLGKFLRDVAKLNQAERNFRIFGPDETLSNLLGAVFEVTNRQWDAREVPNDEFLAPFWTSAGLDAQRASV